MKRRSVLLLVLGTTPALSHSTRAEAIAIGHAWALPTSLSEGQVFMPLLNTGEADDALVAARTGVAAVIELRANNRYDDPPLTEFALASGKPLPMRPTARHLRLIGLKKTLVAGDRFSLVLDFLNAGEAEIEVYVEDTQRAVPSVGLN